MSANDGLDNTSNQPSYLMNYMLHKYDIKIHIMFVNRINATNSITGDEEGVMINHLYLQRLLTAAGYSPTARYPHYYQKKFEKHNGNIRIWHLICLK